MFRVSQGQIKYSLVRVLNFGCQLLFALRVHGVTYSEGGGQGIIFSYCFLSVLLTNTTVSIPEALILLFSLKLSSDSLFLILISEHLFFAFTFYIFLPSLKLCCVPSTDLVFILSYPVSQPYHQENTRINELTYVALCFVKRDKR